MTDDPLILYTWTANEAYAVVGVLERLCEVLWGHRNHVQPVTPLDAPTTI